VNELKDDVLYCSLLVDEVYIYIYILGLALCHCNNIGFI